MAISKFRQKFIYKVILHKLHIYIDKRARIKDGSIMYSLYDFRTKVATKKELPSEEIFRIFNELYPTPEGK